MIKRNLIKGFALGLCMSAVFAGNAYAEAGAGVSSAYAGFENVEDKELLEKQKELDQYLFVDHVTDIENRNFKVVYTGVADGYVEVGITPYSNENADYLYSIFGKDLVKIVGIDEVFVEQLIAPDTPASSSDEEYTTMDFVGITNDSYVVSDGEKLKEAEFMTDENEELNIQIESIDTDTIEHAQMEAEDERIRQSTIADDMASEDQAAKNIAVTSDHDDAVRTISADNEESKKSNLSPTVIIAIVAGGMIVLGGSYLVTNKKKTAKSNIK